ncbi:gas vesicle protein [Streptomyces sp. SP18ES09]|uniref:gas vesicle protein n=1 Tax=Streptomyces sp. SP18ES09 TaxID=3002532 RepID=UPI002E78349C|nr:gas vesicle protein [Streptomyces sp. SP18ES09]MEE1814441.1 gas vesicle protein [Streptomyces sp. SP18ES09]
MSDPLPDRFGSAPSRASPGPYGPSSSANLADILERVLDKGIVIAGDIRINLLDIELLTIKLRILVASVDKAKEMGIDWWEHDPSLSSKHSGSPLERENSRLRAELEALRSERGIGDEARRPEPLRRRERDAEPEIRELGAHEPEGDDAHAYETDDDSPGPSAGTPPRRSAARRRRST